MALDTYAHLQTAIANFMIRPGDTNITDNAPDLITLFEAEATRRLKSRFAETQTTLVTVSGTATVALPSDFGELRSIKISSTDPQAQLVYMTPQEIDETWIASQRAQPVNYTIQGTNLRLAPVPNAVYTLTILYQSGVPVLSATNTTNWLLTNHPDAYLFGSLAEAAAFIGEDERVPMWLQRRDQAFDSILSADRKARWGGGALQIKTDVGNP